MAANSERPLVIRTQTAIGHRWRGRYENAMVCGILPARGVYLPGDSVLGDRARSHDGSVATLLVRLLWPEGIGPGGIGCAKIGIAQ